MARKCAKIFYPMWTTCDSIHSICNISRHSYTRDQMRLTCIIRLIITLKTYRIIFCLRGGKFSLTKPFNKNDMNLTIWIVCEKMCKVRPLNEKIKSFVFIFIAVKAIRKKKKNTQHSFSAEYLIDSSILVKWTKIYYLFFIFRLTLCSPIFFTEHTKMASLPKATVTFFIGFRNSGSDPSFCTSVTHKLKKKN